MMLISKTDAFLKAVRVPDGCDTFRTPNTLVPMMSEHSVFQTVLLVFFVKVDSPQIIAVRRTRFSFYIGTRVM